jgi:hypothetical protein
MNFGLQIAPEFDMVYCRDMFYQDVSLQTFQLSTADCRSKYAERVANRFITGELATLNRAHRNAAYAVEGTI